MKVLVACEESQRVCTAFRERGHEAYSCDIQEPSGGHPEWHIQMDVIEILNPIPYSKEFNAILFKTMDGVDHIIFGKWDLIIAHPPCTYLSSVANRNHTLKCKAIEEINQRTDLRIDAMRFFMEIAEADCDRIVIENPAGVMNTCYRKPDQIIHPYMFADGVDDTENYVTKRTCLWLKGLPPLIGNNLPKPDNETIYGRNPNGKVSNWEEHCTGTNRAAARSKTFPGIARAMAEQWG